MERKFNFSPGEYYHIYQRGNNKNLIFLNDRDYRRFSILLYTANGTKTIQLSDHPRLDRFELFNLDRGESLVEIGAYCLMPNHFHLLVREKKEGGISSLMHRVNTSYSMYHNKKYGQTGSPLEKPFKAKHVDDDNYLKYLFAYIHLNPIKITDPEGWGGKRISDPSRAKIFLDHYPYSSYLLYGGENLQENKIINKNAFPEYFGETKDFEDFIQDWINSSEV